MDKYRVDGQMHISVYWKAAIKEDCQTIYREI